MFLELFHFLPIAFENWKQITWGENFEKHLFFKRHRCIFNGLCGSWIQVFPRKFLPAAEAQARLQERTHLLWFQDPVKGFLPLPRQPLLPGTARQLCRPPRERAEPSFLHPSSTGPAKGSVFPALQAVGCYVLCWQEMMLFPGSLPEATAQSLRRHLLVACPPPLPVSNPSVKLPLKPSSLQSHRQSTDVKPPRPGWRIALPSHYIWQPRKDTIGSARRHP